MDQKNRKDTLNDESFEDIISWGSPLSRDSDNITSSPNTPVNSALDFLDDEEDFQIMNTAKNSGKSSGKGNQISGLAMKHEAKPDAFGSTTSENTSDRLTTSETYSSNIGEVKELNIISRSLFDSDEAEDFGILKNVQGKKATDKEECEPNAKDQPQLAPVPTISSSTDSDNDTKNPRTMQNDIEDTLNSDFDFSPSSIENICKSTANNETKPRISDNETKTAPNIAESFTDEDATSHFTLSDSHEKAPKFTDFLSSESEDFNISASVHEKPNVSSSQQSGVNSHINLPVSSENKDIYYETLAVDENQPKDATLQENEKRAEHVFLDQDGTNNSSINFNNEPEDAHGTSTRTVHFSDRKDLGNNMPVGVHMLTTKNATADLRTISGTVRMVPESHEFTSTNSLGPSQSTKPQSTILVKHIGDVIIKYYRTTTKRYSSHSLVDKVIYIIETHRPAIAEINDNSFKNRTIVDIANSHIKNIQSDYSKIKDILKLRDEEIFIHNVTFSICKEDLNSLVSDKKTLFSTTEDVYKHIENAKSLSPLELNVLRYKMGLGYSLRSKDLSPNLLRQVVHIDNPELTKTFILSQTNRIVFLIIFFKLGMINLKDFEFIYSKNLFYQYVLSKIGVNSVKTKEPRNKWNVRNIVDFGISKILNVEKPRMQDSPLEDIARSGKGIIIPQKKDIVKVENSFMINGKGEKNGNSSVIENTSNKLSTNKIEDDSSLLTKEANWPVKQSSLSPNVPKSSIFDESDEEENLFDRVKPSSIESNAPSTSATASILLSPSEPKKDPASKVNKGAAFKPTVSASSLEKNDATTENSALTRTVNESKDNSTLKSDVEQPQLPIESDTDRGHDDLVSAPEEASQSDVPNQHQLYKKKFSKSFADIFTLEGSNTVNDNVDVSSYVSDVLETDKPIFHTDDSETKGSVISNLFGFFKKKGSEPRKAKDDLVQSRISRPLKAEIQAPEKKERKIIQSSYANMKESQNVDIPGFKPAKK
ncbi:uncharacterized protein VICG_01062 [Vittaforma corneae ATCC 50505]|uniref:Uncharacterized protein n=1 Tax=Vittaforma corneae (strain ATCC 50505) TaxID=993615 RepID=L2GLW1_VITCO|nr:uncharacterized protein VICG_01062 [Vittaforma corneae ATCC 50505]ELA41878.1 hypothetical protein VICG_01062 [Vittaforma corneae ATCC 50505]